MEDARPALRFEALDSWRGVCALWVVLYHFRAVSHVYDWEWVRHGDLAVDFFFVLSGFVITHAYGDTLVRNRDRLVFLLRRFGRLYPLHVATLAVVLLLETGRWAASAVLDQSLGHPPFTGDTSLAALPANLLLVHALGFFREFTWNIPSWSISVEWALCVIFVLLSFFRRLFLAAAVLALAGFLALVWMSLLPVFPFEGHSALVRGVFGFFCGVLVYGLFIRMHRRQIAPPGWTEWMAPLILFAAVLAKMVNLDYLPGLLFSLLVLLFAFQAGPVSRFMRTRPLLFLGEISYSIYLTHYVLVLIIFGLAKLAGGLLNEPTLVERGPFSALLINMPNAWAGDLAALAFLGLVVAVSAVTYAVIENPGRRQFNRLAGRLADAR